MEGVIHIQTNGDLNPSQSGKIYFLSPEREKTEGQIIGKNTLLITTICQELKNHKEQQELSDAKKQTAAEREDDWVRNAITSALRWVNKGHDVGYHEDLIRGQDIIGDWIGRLKKEISSDDVEARKKGRDPRAACISIPADLLRPLSSEECRPSHQWRILDEGLKDSPVSRLNVAVAIVRWGVDQVLNHHWGPSSEKAPAPGMATDSGVGAEAGKAADATTAESDTANSGTAKAPTTAESPKVAREEGKPDPTTEIWQTLTRRLMHNPKDHSPDYITLKIGDWPKMPPERDFPFVEQEDKLKEGFDLDAPIKKFGQLVASDREEIESLSAVKNLLGAYVRDSEFNKRPISLAVFGPPGTGKSFAVKQIAQTIDSDNKLIEILEYNVAQFRTIEDLGEVLTKVASVNNQKKTPLVFFDEFDCALNGQELGWLKFFLAPMQDGNFYGAHQTIYLGRGIFVFAGGTHNSFEEFYARGRQDHRQRRNFEQQKGPDFISRLRGHINILPINADAQQEKHLIRRAIILRDLLKQYGFLHPKNGSEQTAMVDEAVIYALLTVDYYHHGIRSMEQIIQMCTPIDGWIRCGSLPSRAQFNMHVDADGFFIRLHRGRSRRNTQIAPDPVYSE